MTAVALALLTAIQGSPKITLQLFQGEFVIRQGSRKSLVPIKLDPAKPPLAVVFRKNQNFAVWDDRGLNVRVGKKLVSYRLGEIAVSPRINERDQILETIDLIHKGKRTKGATALSGAKRIGNEAYFLVRWDDSSGKPWLEALVKVDLTAKVPGWKLLGKFEGLSLAQKPIDDKLILHNGSLAVIARRDSDWGESFYSASLKAFGFKKIGANLVDFIPTKGFDGLFVEKSDYGTSIAGSVDLETGKRQEMLETRGSIRPIDSDLPLIAVIGGSSLRNADSGAEVRLPASAGVRRTSDGIVVWTPLAKPTKAWLYEPERWQALATWNQAALGNSEGVAAGR